MKAGSRDRQRRESNSWSWGKKPISYKNCFGTSMVWFTPRIISLVQGYAGLDDIPLIENEQLQRFAEHYPDIDLRTLIRFFVARDQNIKKAKNMLDNYLQFKREKLSKFTEAKAQQILGVGQRSVLMEMGKAKDGTTLILFRGCLIKEGISAEEFGTAMAWFMEQLVKKTGPYTPPRFTIAGATNGINGAPNLPAGKLMGIFKMISTVLGDNFPETCQKVIVFPFPMVGRIFWGLAKLFIDPKTAQKFEFLSGSTKRHAEPHRDFWKWVSQDQCVKGWLGPLEERKEAQKTRK
mmetsp:Transcript_10786/g.15019  ORF Transcript_10786/g.15019 Transcript_10786/m.15019 type:complete len:293 (-) Transcript_10786:246-1124(-)